jgi:predicted AlkP superfamily phosphohydrolase/phosphomutase
MPRVAAIGLDAMEWSVAERLMDDGKMPNLRALRDRGAHCRLENVVPYRSELPWTLFLTGKEPQDNRYWSTVEFDPTTYEAYTVGAHPVPPFYAFGPDKKVIAFDVPHSVPSDDVHGVQVMAWGAHSPQYPRASSPQGLLAEIDDTFGPHPGFDNDYDGVWWVPRFLDKLADAQLEGSATRVDIVQWLQQREPDWDFLITVMSEPHSAGHHMWHGIDDGHPLRTSTTAEQARRRLIEVYSSLDAQVGRLIEGLPDDTSVVVFAVHGMQANANDVPSMVLLPELLHRITFGNALLGVPGQARWLQDGSPAVQPSERYKWEVIVRRSFGEGVVGRTRRFAQAFVPEELLERALRVRRRLTGRPEPRPPWEFRGAPAEETSLTLDEVVAQRGTLQWQAPSWYRAYWPRMKWFTLPTFSDAHVRINLKGRERDGVVELADYDEACDEFEALLRACRDPRTGGPIVDQVIRVRADDPMAPDGPDGDLVVLWAEPLDAIEHPDAGIIGPVPFNRTGEHSSNGFAFFAGPGIEPADLGVRKAYDMTPSVLSLLGIEPGADLAGRTLFERSPVVPTA